MTGIIKGLSDNMNTTMESISKITGLIQEVIGTASRVNIESVKRKNITVDGLKLTVNIINNNSERLINFDKVHKNLNCSLESISANSLECMANIEIFQNIIKSINGIKTVFDSLKTEISMLTGIVAEVRDDTDEIFTLALNASIVSSKYSHTSGVFDILSNKLDEMSNFINKNLDNIVKVVDPVTDGIINLMKENSLILSEISKGNESYAEFPRILNGQKQAMDDILVRIIRTDEKVIGYRKMLNEITEKFSLMDNDAGEAITGSGNVMKTGEDLALAARAARDLIDSGKDFNEKIRYIMEQGNIIRETAARVNQKSISQLRFSLKSINFCDQIIGISRVLMDTARTFTGLSQENSRMVRMISEKLNDLIGQLTSIEGKIAGTSTTIQVFIGDYSQIDSVIEFLKDVLKSMKIIGMLSRIESSRDPEEFHGFMTISDNIEKLQDRIQNNIPVIEENIRRTHELILRIKSFNGEMTADFSLIIGSSREIIKNLMEITGISSDSEAISGSINSESEEQDRFLGSLRALLTGLAEIVKVPIEGSASNIERGAEIARECRAILGLPEELEAVLPGASYMKSEEPVLENSEIMAEELYIGNDELEKLGKEDSVEEEFNKYEKIFLEDVNKG